MSSDKDVEAWVQWAGKAAFTMLVQSFEGAPIAPLDEPRAPTGAGGMGAGGLAVAWWTGDELRAIAWEEDQKPSAELLALLVEQSSEGDDDAGRKPIARREVESLRVTVAVLGKRRKLADGEAALDAHEALMASNKFVFPEQLQRSTLAAELATAKKGARAVQVVCGGYRLPAAAASVALAPKKAAGGAGWGWKIGVALFIAAMLYMRYMDATYDVRWDAFVSNYGLLGLPVDAPLSDVKKAYHRMSMTQHPDKMGAACDQACSDRWVAVSNAYAEIKDFHSGRLRLVGRPTRFDEEFA